MIFSRRSPVVLAALLLLAGCQQDPVFPFDEVEANQLRALYDPAAPPADPTNALADVPAAVELGRALFHDPGFSPCQISCSTCHRPDHGYSDSVAFSTGCHGALTGRNVPSALNAGYRRWLFWDGRKDTLWAQATGPLLNPNEMGADPAGVKVAMQEHYAAEYTALFGKAPVDETDPDALLANFGKAVEAYERTLVRVRSPFDVNITRFLNLYDTNGDVTSDPSYLQFKTFVRKGRCMTCHSGPMLSDEAFHNIGVKDVGEEAERQGRAGGISQFYDAAGATYLDVFNGMGEYSDDPRLANGTNVKLNELFEELNDPAKLADHVGAFKTPNLRNVALTAPYFHNGSRATLMEVVDFYNEGGDADGTFAGHRTTAGTIKRLELTDEEKQALVDLLESLTGSEEP